MNEITLSEAIKLLASLLMIANMALNVYLFRRTVTGAELKAMREAQRKGDEVLGTRVERVESRHGDFDRRLSVLETRVSALPTHDDLSELKTELAANTERTESTFQFVRDIHHYLLRKTQ